LEVLDAPKSYWVEIEIIMGVSDPQVMSGVQKNNNASDHGNTNRLMTAVKSQRHRDLPVNASVRNSKGVE
jgi:hypothetical protein